jgi:hypothetical protein
MAVLFGYGGEPRRDRGRVDESGVEQYGHEVPVLLAESSELGDAQVFLAHAPPRVLRLPCEWSRVRVLNLDQPVTPPVAGHPLDGNGGCWRAFRREHRR